MRINVKEILRKFLKDNHTSYLGMSKKMGKKGTGFISNSVQKGTLSSNMLLDICETYEYDLIMKPRRGENKSERSIVINEYLEDED